MNITTSRFLNPLGVLAPWAYPSYSTEVASDLVKELKMIGASSFLQFGNETLEPFVWGITGSSSFDSMNKISLMCYYGGGELNYRVFSPVCAYTYIYIYVHIYI